MKGLRTKPVMIYDGECEFCRRWVERFRKATGDKVDFAPYQEVAPAFPQISFGDFRNAVQLVEPHGPVSSGAEAVARALSYVKPRRRNWALWFYRNVPGAAAASEHVYRRVAMHRGLLGKLEKHLLRHHH